MLPDLIAFSAIGFLAQLVDGALGMAYGVTATSVLLQIGTPPAVASASGMPPRPLRPALPALRIGALATLTGDWWLVWPFRE